MKAVVIVIVLLFLGIFGTKKFMEIQEENATKAAEKEYNGLKMERESMGDTLNNDAFIKFLDKVDVEVAIERPELAPYLTEEGYRFDCVSLEYPKRLGEATGKKRFHPSVMQFGPKRLKEWKSIMVPPIATNPTPRMLSAKILRNFTDWRQPMQDIITGLITGTKDGGLLGIHKLRKLEPAQKAAAMKKFVEFQRARITIGRLQYYKGSSSHPYNVAEDLILLSDLFAKEAVTVDEVAVSRQLDNLTMKYIEFLAGGKKLSRRMTKIQESLMDIDLNQSIFNALQLKRIDSTAKLEANYSILVKRERDALSIFESGYVLTEKEKWQLLIVYQNAGIILCYTDAGKTRRTRFTQSVLKEFGDYVNSTRNEMGLNKDAVLVYNSAMKALERRVHEIMGKVVRRHNAAVKLAIAHYYQRTKAYPATLQDLTEKDIIYLPKNPLSGEDYEYEFSPETQELAMKDPDFLPSVRFKLKAKTVVK